MDRAIKIFPLILLILHTVGIGLFLHFSQAPSLSFVNILLSAILVLIAENKGNTSFIIFSIIFILGYVIELLGVQYGILFGSYEYGEAMGPMILGTPLIIGATWYAVVVGSSTIARKYIKSIVLQSLFAGLLAVTMDFVIEQVAINYGLWSWENGSIPIYNYLCWYIFGTLFSYIYLKFTINQNETARYLYWIWLGFFTILTLF